LFAGHYDIFTQAGVANVIFQETQTADLTGTRLLSDYNPALDQAIKKRIPEDSHKW